MALAKDRFKCDDAVVFTDPDGCTITYKPIKGTKVNMVSNMDKYFSEFPDVVARHDDVMTCGYPKAGTHWIWEVTSMIIKKSSDYAREIKEHVMMEFTGKSVNEVPSPRILNSHVPLNYLPPDIIAKKCKLIYLLRNPKDLAVSHYNHVRNIQALYEGTWNGFFELYMEGKVEFGDVFEYLLEWENALAEHPELPIHVWYYEDMKKVE